MNDRQFLINCCIAINHFFRFTIPIQKIFRFRAAVFLSGSTTDTSWILLPSSPSPGARRAPARTAGPPPSWRFRRRFAPSVTWTSSPRPTDRRDTRDNTSLSPTAPGSLYLKVLLSVQPWSMVFLRNDVTETTHFVES